MKLRWLQPWLRPLRVTLSEPGLRGAKLKLVISVLDRAAGYNLRLAAVAVAQLVESRIVIPVVVGSSPISHPNEFKAKPVSIH